MFPRRDVLEQIFDLLLSGNRESESEYLKSTFREPHIKQKIRANFSSHQFDIISKAFTALLPDIVYIGALLEDKSKLDEQPVNRLVERIQSIFLKIINGRKKNKALPTASTEIAINDFVVFDEIVEELLKPYHRSFTTEELSAAKSVVLCVFEYCDIGLPPKTNNIFENPKRIVDPDQFSLDIDDIE